LSERVRERAREENKINTFFIAIEDTQCTSIYNTRACYFFHQHLHDRMNDQNKTHEKKWTYTGWWWWQKSTFLKKNIVNLGQTNERKKDNERVSEREKRFFWERDWMKMWKKMGTESMTCDVRQVKLMRACKMLKFMSF
jgi:hypothetical protein